MRTFVIGDIHGGLKALLQVLNQLELKEQDHLIFMGDYVDGWSQSAQVISFLIQLETKFNCVFILGNHDAWCRDWLRDGTVNPSWYLHGGAATLTSYEECSPEEKQRHLSFFDSMKYYHIDNQNRLFLHAGFTSMHGVTKEKEYHSFCSDRTLWEMALVADTSLEPTHRFYPRRVQHYHEIYIGHTPTINYGEDAPMQALNIWNVDTGAAFTGKLTAMDIDSKSYYQSDDLPSLYPDEKGRN
jgi:serine/threonine protein phosphatase 1